MLVLSVVRCREEQAGRLAPCTAPFKQSSGGLQPPSQYFLTDNFGAGISSEIDQDQGGKGQHEYWAGQFI